MTNQYEYQSIYRSTSDIRLLELFPRESNDKLRNIPACRIFHTSLHKHPKFVALSYVWGDAQDSRMILVENYPVRVTRNLYDAMMALRPIKKSIIIWIDSLCINQLDKKEKSWQVGLMADIYQHANKVVSWLGSSDQSSDSVLDYLNSFGAKAEACCMDVGPGPYLEAWQELAMEASRFHDLKRSKTSTRTLADRTPRSSQNALGRLFYSISGWHDQDHLFPIAGMESFFTRPWWGRIWVLQEVTLPENAEFICGTKTITRSRCSAALNAYCALWRILTAKFATDPTSLTPYQRGIAKIIFQHRPTVMLSSWRIYRYSRFPLAALLRLTCVGSINIRRHGGHHLEATNPRDKIFALLGLAADRKELEGLGVVPDYEKSYEQVYATTMAAMLQQGYLSLLSMCRTSKSPHLPSWVPDWSGSIIHMLQDVEDDHVTIHPKFNASGAEPRDSKVIVVQKYGVIEGISVMCYLYDEIHRIGCFPDRVSTHEVPLLETFSWPVEWLLEFIRLTYSSEQFYGEFSDRLGAAARSSIGGVGFNQDARLARVGDDRFADSVVLLQKGIKHIKEKRFKSEAQQFLARKTVKAMIKRRVAVFSKLGPDIMGKSLGRLPLITKKGHLVLSSEHVQQYDVIALIKGAQVPFVFRRQSSGQYQVISEAYVDGIMDGEAMESSKCKAVVLV